jgi:hypothetical protein
MGSGIKSNLVIWSLFLTILLSKINLRHNHNILAWADQTFGGTGGNI